MVVAAEERDQHGRSRSTGGSVRRGIIRYGWREQQWLPAEIRHREIIAVRARAPDGSEWPPEVVEILRVKGGDVGVGQGHFQSGKEACVLSETVGLLGDEQTRDPAPAVRGALIPEDCQVGLVGCACGAVDRAEGFDFIEVKSVTRDRARCRARARGNV